MPALGMSPVAFCVRDGAKSGERPARGVFPEDLEAAEAAQGVQVEAGDALLSRFGWCKRRQQLGPPPPPGRPGLHAATLPWLHQRGVSILVADASPDVDPSGSPTIGLPIHKVGIVAMGLWLLDAADCAALVDVCRSQLHIDRVLVDPHLIDGHIVRQWPAEELAGAHIVPGEVSRAYDDMAFELPPGEGGPIMPARVADDVEGPCHVDQKQPLLVGDDHLHLAWG
jgi:Putative cyclase